MPADVLRQDLPDGEAIFLDLRTEVYVALDRVGSQMYSALVTSDSIGAAYEQLQEQFDVPPDRLRHDLVVFVRRLIDQGLLQLHD